MKKGMFWAVALMLAFGLTPVCMTAGTEPDSVKVRTSAPIGPDEAAVLISRLEEIRDMDKSGLSFTEKRELRKEVRETRAVLNGSGNGVYISVGALILIILLLIILL